MKLNLVVMNQGKATGKSIPITLSQFIIGRDPQCQLRPASALISKRHCALIARTGKYFVRDFDSTNGTFVNGEPIKGEREIKNEDVLAVGPLTFKVAMEVANVPASKQTPTPSTKAPTPPPPRPAAHSPSDDDDSAGSMLLDLADEGGEEKVEAPAPEATTISEVAVPEGNATASGDTKTDAPPVKDAKAPDKRKGMGGDTSAAAEALLQKYMRRQRS